MSDTAQLFEDIIGFIGHLRERLASDAPVTVESLDAQVAALTEHLNSLPLQERLSHRAELDKLGEVLRAFEAELTQERDALRERLSGIGSHRQASVAYRTADSRDGGRKTDNS